tara:strand:- start:1298 stop:2017 length:720 start_codon:yes stop_codon:yes gene_type:complete
VDKNPKFHRVLIKLSGEMMSSEKKIGIDSKHVNYLAEEIKSVHSFGVQTIVIIGAGNIFRGITAASNGMDRVTGDYLGMLATIMNAIALQEALEKMLCQTRTLSAITVSHMAETYIRRRAIRHLEKGRIVIIAGGTGNPFFTTDSAAGLRAIELNADILIKATKVDGVFNKDPIQFEDALKYNEISYDDVLKDNLRIMDLTAITLCKENNLPIRVFDIKQSGNLKEIIMGANLGTLVSG